MSYQKLLVVEKTDHHKRGDLITALLVDTNECLEDVYVLTNKRCAYSLSHDPVVALYTQPVTEYERLEPAYVNGKLERPSLYIDIWGAPESGAHLSARVLLAEDGSKILDGRDWGLLNKGWPQVVHAVLSTPFEGIVDAINALYE